MVTKLADTIEGRGETKGYTYTKVFENDKGYVYKAGENHFEAFYKRESKVCIDFDKKIFSETDTKEIYPKSNAFGVWAWTVRSLDNGIEKLS